MIDFRTLLHRVEKPTNQALFEHIFIGDFELSIQASEKYRCTPKETLDNPYLYHTFEVAIYENGEIIEPATDARFDSFATYNLDWFTFSYMPASEVQRLCDLLANRVIDYRDPSVIRELYEAAGLEDTIWHAVNKTVMADDKVICECASPELANFISIIFEALPYWTIKKEKMEIAVLALLPYISKIQLYSGVGRCIICGAPTNHEQIVLCYDCAMDVTNEAIYWGKLDGEEEG